MSEYNVARVVGQALVPVMSNADVAETTGNYMLKKVVSGEFAYIAGTYMRDARILDMSKPLYVSAVAGQALAPVMVSAKLTEVAVIVLQAQQDRVIRPLPGGLQQHRIY